MGRSAQARCKASKCLIPNNSSGSPSHQELSHYVLRIMHHASRITYIDTLPRVRRFVQPIDHTHVPERIIRSQAGWLPSG